MDNQHAIDNAQGWLVSIREMIEAFNFATGAGTSVERVQEIEAAETAIHGSPLSVLVRSGWYLPGAPGARTDSFDRYRPDAPSEYEILLATGGPGTRIIGDLGAYGEPGTATLQWQDWGVPWTDFHMADLPEDMTPSDADAVLLSYARHFYFGE